MRRALIVLFIVLFTGASLAYLGGFQFPELVVPGAPERAEVPVRTEIVKDLAETLTAKAAGPVGEPRFDIARLDPEGTSVFAGQAPPESDVTILADGTPIGTAKADNNGEWTLTAERAVKTREAKLSVHLGRTELVAPQELSVESDKPGSKSKERTVASRLVDDLEKLVAKAREEEAARTAPKRSPPVATAAVVEGDRVPQVRTIPSAPTEAKAASPNQAQGRAEAYPVPAQRQAQVAAVAPQMPTLTPNAAPTVSPVSIPVPITFVYNETEFTAEGRRAATLLLEYMRLKRFQSVSLTGHADERGSSPFNVELSRERLDAVAEFLRGGGFTGKLDLVAKGESEPFSRIDRAKIAADDLYQLDRRVELRLTN